MAEAALDTLDMNQLVSQVNVTGEPMTFTNDRGEKALLITESMWNDDRFRRDIRTPTAIGGMTNEEITAEVLKGWEDMKAGRVYTSEEMDVWFEELERELLS